MSLKKTSQPGLCSLSDVQSNEKVNCLKVDTRDFVSGHLLSHSDLFHVARSFDDLEKAFAAGRWTPCSSRSPLPYAYVRSSKAQLDAGTSASTKQTVYSSAPSLRSKDAVWVPFDD